MAWWVSITSMLSVGLSLRTPGRGMPPTRQGTFTIHSISPTEMIIESGQGQIILEKACFDIVEQAFIAKPTIRLRVASLHDNLPLPDSVDKLIRDATGSNLARGNYVSSILAYCNLVKYEMNGRQKVIVLQENI
jgi:hypothetical protein